jgi:hypothetical protein
MKVLVLGASGATGKRLVGHLLDRGIAVRAMLRAGAALPPGATGNPLLEIVRGDFAGFGTAEIDEALRGCDAVASCLGHRTSFRGLFGKPRDLVNGAVKAVCRQAGGHTGRKIKLVLMGTTAYQHTRSGERYALGDRIILGMLKLLLPPHRDNVRAADFLAGEVGRDNPDIEWTVVRPDTLVDRDSVTPYEVHGAPLRSPVSNAGTTSRTNVGHFMAELLADEALWAAKRFTMPVLYDR